MGLEKRLDQEMKVEIQEEIETMKEQEEEMPDLDEGIPEEEGETTAEEDERLEKILRHFFGGFDQLQKAFSMAFDRLSAESPFYKKVEDLKDQLDEGLPIESADEELD